MKPEDILRKMKKKSTVITSIQYNTESLGQKFQARKVNKGVHVGKEVKLS